MIWGRDEIVYLEKLFVYRICCNVYVRCIQLYEDDKAARGGVTKRRMAGRKIVDERGRRKYEARKEKKRREHAETGLNLRSSAVKYREPRLSDVPAARDLICCASYVFMASPFLLKVSSYGRPPPPLLESSTGSICAPRVDRIVDENRGVRNFLKGNALNSKVLKVEV